MLSKQRVFSLLLLLVFVLNFVTLFINEDDYTSEKRKLEPREKTGYPPSLVNEQWDSALENGGGNHQLDTSPLTSSPDTRSSNIDLGGIRSKIQSDYSNPNWVDTRWRYRKNITIDNTKVSVDLTNFPMLVNLHNSDLRNDAQTSGDDIFFTDESGNKLDHEIEFYNRVYNSTHAHLVAWVKTNLSSSQDTLISMYYGNPTASNQENPTGVWNNNFVLVQHLNDDPSGTIIDSSIYQHQGTQVGSMTSTNLVTGKITNAYYFNSGASQAVNIPDHDSLDITNNFTIEAWINVPAAVLSTGDHAILSHRDNEGYQVAFKDGALRMKILDAGSTKTVEIIDPGMIANSWYHVVTRFEGPNMYIFINGTEVATNTGHDAITSYSTSFPLRIGSRASGSNYFEGKIDEVRVSNTLRSNDWISTEYDNQNEPDSFYSVSSKELSPDSSWSMPSYSYRKTITINAAQVSGSGNLINFPVLVNLTDSDLKNTYKVQADGDDILFTNASGTKLDHEIEYFDQSTGHLTAWVRVPSLSATSDTNIMMYYGNDAATSQENPTDVWDAKYMGVWHKQDLTTSTVEDSTTYGLDGTKYTANEPVEVNGQVWKAQTYDGTDDYIVVPDDANQDTGGEISIELWAYSNVAKSGQALVIHNHPSRVYMIYLSSASLRWYVAGADVRYESFSQDQWYHVVVTYNRSLSTQRLKIYLNGSIAATADGSDIDIPAGANGLHFGTMYNSLTNGYEGILDEIRLSNIALSADWIATEYNNQYDPNSFYSVGSEEISLSDWSMPLFRHRKTITINASQVNGTLTDFPVLINIFDTDLHDTGNVQVDGDDIAFTDASGNRLDHEIELFNQTSNGTHANLVAWIKVPSISNSSDTNIKMYYGNNAVNSQEDPSGVWNDNYAGVWHLGESSGNAQDSTSYGTEGIPSGGVIQGTTGQILGAYEFDGIDDVVNMGDPVDGHLDFGTSSFSYSFWINIAQTTQYVHALNKGSRIAGEAGYCFYKRSDTGDASVTIGDTIDRTKSDFAISVDTWLYVVGVADRNNNVLHAYINAVEQGSGVSISSVGSVDNSYDFVLSRSGDEMDGFFDEVRISNVALSADWIATEYNNQYDPNSFYSVGSEENSPSDWSMPLLRYRKTITINASEVSGSGSLTNFPVLVNLTDSDLQDINKVQVDGDDLAFTDTSGTKLDHEIEYFNQSTGNLIAWVKVPSISATSDTNITIYYGNSAVNSQENPTGVWDSNYVMIQHLNEDPTEIIYDSTANNHDGTTSGSMESNNLVDGKIGKAIDFESSKNQTIEMSDSNDFDMTETLTLSAWINVPASVLSTGEYHIIAHNDYWNNMGYVIMIRGGDLEFRFHNGTALMELATSSHGITADTWHHIIGYFDRPTIRLYVDGSQVANDTIDYAINHTLSVPIRIGRSAIGFYPFNGSIDEVRVSNVARSADWIATGYNNQHDPTNFLSVDTEEIYSNWWADGSFSKRKEIVINKNKVSGDLNDFPVLVDLYDIDMHDINKIQADGSDILFTDASGTKLDHEIELFDQAGNGTHAHLVVWVRIPGLSCTEDTIISMYYGNSVLENQEFPTGVWDSNFAAVWHLNENPPQVEDSTLSNSNGTSYGSMTSGNQVNGQIGGSLDFDGLNDYINFGNPSELQITGAITIELWLRADFVGNYDLLSKMGDSGQRGWDLSLTDDAAIAPDGWVMLRYSPDGSMVNYTGWDRVNASQWNHVVGVFNPSTYSRFYFNGQMTSEKTINVPSSLYNVPVNLYLGRKSGATSYYDGIFDEVRVSKSARSADWIATEYNNQYDVASFYSVGSETVYDATPPVVNDYGVDDPGTGIGNFWAVITDTASDVTSATIMINGTEYSLSNNGTHWIYQQSVNLTDYYTYQITNASDIYGNNLTATTSEKSYTFIQDSIAPTVVDWEYYAEQGPYGTFNTNVSDAWGEIDTVMVNVTNRVGKTAVMKNTTAGYINDTLVLTEGQIYFTIFVNDTGGNNFTSAEHNSIVPSFNNVPIASNLTLSRDQALVLLPVYSNSTLDLDYDYYDEDNNNESGTEIRWFKNGVLQAIHDDKTSIASSDLFAGDQWNATVRPNDGLEFGVLVASPLITIQNSAPEVTTASVSPGSPVTTTNLTATYNYFDTDGDSENTGNREIEWFKNGQTTGLTSLTVDSLLTAKGEDWSFKIRVHDGTQHSNWYQSANVTIINTAPTATSLNIVNAGNLRTTDDLVANWTFSDDDGDVQVAYYILWYKNSLLQPSLNGTMIVTAANTSKGQSWSFKLIVNDGTVNSSADWATALASATVQVLNSPPEASGLTITTTPYTTDNLVADWNYTDADTDGQSSYLIRWYKDGVIQPSLNDSMTVSSSLSSKGETWNYTLQVHDGEDYSIVYNSTSVTILNSVPTASGLTITTNPYNTSNLVASWTFNDDDAGDSQAGYTIYWYRDGVSQSHLDNKATVEASNTSKGETWNYTAYVHDGESWSIAYNSSTTTILNSKPTATGLNIENSGNLRTTDDLVANWTFSDLDADLQASFYILWYKNDILQPLLNNTKSVDASNTSKDQSWYFTLVVYDGEENSTLYTLSPPVQILNAAPTATGVSITSNPNTTTQLLANWIFDDVDTGDVEISFLIRWYEGGILRPALNDSKTVSSSLTSKGEEWNYTLQVFDGEDYSIVYNSSTVTILNLAPTVSGLTITSTPYNTTDLEASWTFVDDDSGDNQVDFYVRWYKNGVLQASLDDETTLEAANTTKGEQWNFTLQVFDGESWSIIYNSSITDILNSAPTITGSPTFNKTISVLETDTLNITYAYYDPDLDSEGSAIIYWYKNNASGSYYIQSKDNHVILYSTDTSDGDFWYYKIRVHDGITYSNNYTSIGVAINFVNGKPEALNVQIISDLYTTDDLVGNYVYSDPTENHSEAGTLYAWYWFNSSSGKYELQHAYNNTLTLPASATAKGDQWKFSVRPKDGLDYSVDWHNSSAITILNTQPTASGLILTSNPYNTTNLVANWTFADIDADSQADYYIRWYKDNVLQSQLDNKTTIEAANTTKGEVWNYTLQVQDGESWSTFYYSSNTTILNTVPAATGLTLTANPYTTTDLVAGWTFSDPVDNDSQYNYTVRWYKNGELQVDLNDTITVEAGNTTKGENWKYYLQVHDGEAWSITYISTTVTSLNTAPEASSVDLTSNPSTTENLVATWSSSDDDGDDVVGPGTYLIRWYKGGLLQASLNDSTTVAASLTTKGEEWNYTIQVFDGSDYSTVYNSPTITILNSIPIASGLTITSNPYNFTDLVVDWTFADNDTVDSQDSYEIRWYKDGSPQPLLNDKITVEASNTTKGEVWNYTLRVHDGETYSNYYNSTMVTIINALPTATGLNIEKAGSLRTTDNLVANWTFSDLDLDSQDSYNISWYWNGILQGDLNDTITVTAGNTTKSEYWKFTLQVHDGEGWSIIYTSTAISILNTAPEVSGVVTITATSFTRGNDLTVDYTYFDTDNDQEIGTEIRWYKNNVLEPAYNDLTTIPGSAVFKGDHWNVTVLVSDGSFQGTLASSTAYTILNTAPVVTSGTILYTGDLTTESTLGTSYNTTDADGDTTAVFQVIWWVDNQTGTYERILALENLTILTPASTLKDQHWKFDVRVFDGDSWSDYYNTSFVTILNTPPKITNVTLSGGSTTDEDITVTYAFIDPDGDSDVGTDIVWQVIRGVTLVTGIPPGSTLASSDIQAGDLVFCIITPDDGDDQG
ncbi:MAG: DUF2341 domain-containing protein, partial [Candidatus Hodarchaeales archaeon]